MTITLIAAMDRSRAIGVQNELPWRLPADMAYFKDMTIKKTVLMGRKTYESLGRPLPYRRNVVLTRKEDLRLEGCEIIHNPQEAIERFSNEELMVIGGSEIYSLFLPHADKLLLTDVETTVQEADAFFPAFNEEEWKLTASVFREKDDRNGYNMRFQTYVRIKGSIGEGINN